MRVNTKNIFLSSGLALAMMTMVPAAVAQSDSQSLTDVRQEVQILTSYALNPYLRVNDLKATVKDGKVTLTGHVPEGVNKELAREIALGVSGIKEVDNQIVVDADRPPPIVTSAGSYAEVIDDATITAAVKAKLLWSKYTDGLQTTVTTKSGRVTLEGTADTPAARELAGQLAGNTRGVVSVKNMLTISKPEQSAKPIAQSSVTGAPAGTVMPQTSSTKVDQTMSDAWITTKVKSTLLYSSNVAGTDIEVTTSGGNVTLKGRLGSGAERALAIELAQNIKGVNSVNAKDLTF
jgi:osmotically-inducible protein OsmY